MCSVFWLYCCSIAKKAISEETQRISAELVAEITAPLSLGNAHESDNMESSEESDDETWGCVVEQERPQVGMKTLKSSSPHPPGNALMCIVMKKRETWKKRSPC